MKKQILKKLKKQKYRKWVISLVSKIIDTTTMLMILLSVILLISLNNIDYNNAVEKCGSETNVSSWSDHYGTYYYCVK